VLILLLIFLLQDFELVGIFLIQPFMHLRHIIHKFIPLLSVVLVVVLDSRACIIMLSVDLLNCRL